MIGDDIMRLMHERDQARSEAEHLRRGIAAYRMAHECDDLDSEWPAVEGCASCAWEQGEGKVREESGDASVH